jgi:hypothetical protein
VRTPARVHFNTFDFRKEHARLPRGVAIWVFYFSDAPEDPWIPRSAGRQLRLPMSYQAAKDYATAEAMRRRVTRVKLGANPL